MAYDMHVSSETVEYVKEKILNIANDLSSSTQEMFVSVNRAQGFLAGNQYNKAQQTTMDCINITNNTVNSLADGVDYLEEINLILEEYNQCRYRG